MKECDHEFEMVYMSEDDIGDTSIDWCKLCGTLVIDKDYRHSNPVIIKKVPQNLND